MMKLFVALGMVALVGCSSASLTEKKPIFQAHTTKTPDEVNRCLAPKMLEWTPATTSMQTEQGWLISSSADFVGTFMVTKINKSGDGGSDIVIYAVSKGSSDPFGSRARMCI
ncbi:hypothetical protein [Hafnia alvei]|uniref:Lipoprotein n=2 Tax=Hafnia alvei TaxID=569 RepID=A0A377PIS0_HAFAL|nr:hypothetical protein [Hafnia alvei]KFC88007.1 Gp19 family protein [Hafnia alvei ATCC 13337]RLR05928.1 hypothetical protein EAE69_22415 [Hafnia alvei ATCC 13337]WQD26388.1 hypothetical protein U0008_05590 [Hafnia alvei]STQ79233.1 Uncharacterised protein [Hafnia alvei]